MSAEAFYEESTLNKDRLSQLFGLSSAIEERRHEFDLSSAETPPEVRSLGHALAVPRLLGLEPNVATFKRYDNNDGYLSGAYSPHPDPLRYSGRIAIISIDNLAYFFREMNNQISPTECRSGKLVVMDPRIIHWVTPPMEGDIRHMIFYGYDTTKPPLN